MRYMEYEEIPNEIKEFIEKNDDTHFLSCTYGFGKYTILLQDNMAKCLLRVVEVFTSTEYRENEEEKTVYHFSKYDTSLTETKTVLSMILDSRKEEKGEVNHA